MKKQDILKELKAISEAMTENTIAILDENQDDSKMVTVTEDFKTFDLKVEYNGWSDRVEALIKSLEETEESKLKNLVVNAGEILSHDSSVSYEKLEKEIIRLTEISDVQASLDHSLSDNFNPTEANEHCYTVGTFLDAIGYEQD